MAESLHTRLLAYTTPVLAGEYSAARLNGPLGAIRAMVELHAPVPCGFPLCRTPETHRVCKACGSGINSPCSTIQVIAEALGVKDEERIEKEKQRG